MTEPALSPIRRSVSVSWDPAAAFRRFTDDFATWWPSSTHSIGEKRIKRIVFETRVGGRIFEEHLDGRRFQWGVVTAWNPPHGVSFSWHPSRPEDTAQQVDLSFVPEGTGTRLELVSSNWERWGKGARGARRGYDVGWGYVLNVWGGKRTLRMLAMDALVIIAKGVQWARGGVAASIARAEGAMPPA